MKKHIPFILLFLFLFLPGVGEEISVEKCLRDLDGSGDREKALEWLARLREPRAIPYLAEILDKKNRYMTDSAIRHLGRIGHPDGIIPLIDYLLTSNERYYDHKCLDSLRQIDPGWMKREEVRGYIPRFLEAYKKAWEAGVDKKNPYASRARQASLLKFIYLTAPQQAVPISLHLIENHGGLAYYIPGMILDNLVALNVREARGPILREIFNPRESRWDRLSLPALAEALDKLHPGWRHTNAFETHLKVCLNKIEEGKTPGETGPAMDIAKIVKPSSLIPLLEKIISDPQKKDDMKAAAIIQLGEIAPADHFGLFVSRLKSTDTRVRYACISSLGKTGDAKAVKSLIELLRDPDENDKWAVISALEGLNSGEAVRPLADFARNSGNIDLVVPVIKALSAVEPGAPVNEMTGVWEKWREKLPIYQHRDVMSCFFNVSDPRMMDYLIRFYPTASDEVKKQLLAFFIKKKDRRLLPIFREALKSTDIRIRAYAECGLNGW